MTVTVTPTVDLANTPPRVRLNVTASAGETSTTVIRNDANGVPNIVRTSDGNPLPISGGVALVYDYEIPYGQAVTYTTLESPSTVSASTTIDPGAVWLIHPGVPSLSMTVTFRPGTLQEEVFTATRGVFYPMGRANAVVVTDGVRKSSQSTLIVATQSQGELVNLGALLSTNTPLLLNIPVNLGLGFATAYISVGDVKVARLTSMVDDLRDVTLPITVVDSPAGGSQSQRTMADLLSFTSLAQVQAAYSSLTALLAGP